MEGGGEQCAITNGSGVANKGQSQAGTGLSEDEWPCIMPHVWRVMSVVRCCMNGNR